MHGDGEKCMSKYITSKFEEVLWSFSEDKSKILKIYEAPQHESKDNNLDIKEMGAGSEYHNNRRRVGGNI